MNADHVRSIRTEFAELMRLMLLLLFEYKSSLAAIV